jgi:hypothetical protein
MNQPYNPFAGADGRPASFDDSRAPCPSTGLGKHRVVIEQVREWASNKDGRVRYYGIDYTILEPDPSSTAQVGGKHTFMQTYAGNQFPAHDQKALSAIKAAVGAAFGLDLRASDSVTSQQIFATVQNKALLAGHVVDIEVSQETSKNGKTICNHKVYPVVEMGKPMERPVPGGNPTPAPAGAAPGPVGGMPGVPTLPGVPATPVAPSFPPAGWTQHPQNPVYWFKDQTVLSETDLRALMVTGRA